MLFLLQKEENEIKDIEIFKLREILNRQRYQHEYTYMTLKDFSNANFLAGIKNLQNAVPVGTIDFVQKYLKTVYNIDFMNPIEIPNELRLDKFINRRYAILDKKDLPKSGYYFIKYASKLKEFSCTCDIESIQEEPDHRMPTLVPNLKNGLYVVSQVVNILSEFRCFILRDKIIGIQYYDGDCTVLPNEQDIQKLQEMVMRYSINPKRPQAYTLDVALVKDKGLSILECHPFSSVGLYGLSSGSLPDCYRLGVDWYINHNTPLLQYSNFKKFNK